MRVTFLARCQIAATVYAVGDVADIDDDYANDYIRRGLARFSGSGPRASLAWLDVVQSASAINPAGAVAAATIDTTETGWPGTLLFSGSADNMLAGSWQINHDWQEGSAIRPHIHWMLTANSANAVGWEFYHRVSGIGAAAGAWVGPVAGTLAVSHDNVADQQAITSFGEIPLPGQTVSCVVAWRLYRRGTTDANNADARLLFIDFHYQSDGTGSWAEYSKDG